MTGELLPFPPVVSPALHSQDADCRRQVESFHFLHSVCQEIFSAIRPTPKPKHRRGKSQNPVTCNVACVCFFFFFSHVRGGLSLSLSARARGCMCMGGREWMGGWKEEARLMACVLMFVSDENVMRQVARC